MAKNSIKILDYSPGSFGILVHFSSSLRIHPGSFFWFNQNPGSFSWINQNPGSFSRFNHNPGSFSWFIQNPSSFSRFIQNPTSISTYPLDQNICAHPRHLNFYVSTRPKYSCASLTPPFLRTYSTKIFLRTLDSYMSMYMYLLNQNILAHNWFLHFYVSTRP